MEWTEEKLEKFIKENKDALIDGCRPVIGHEGHFLLKLSKRFKKFISIVPYLVKVLIITVIIFACSIFVWYKFLKHPIASAVIEKFEDKK
jgi:hypothetical protein